MKEEMVSLTIIQVVVAYYHFMYDFLCVMIGNLLVFIANFALHQSYILLAPQKRIVIRSFLTSNARYAKVLTTQRM